MSKQTGGISEELRRFRCITKDQSKIRKFNDLIVAKNLSRGDVTLILETLSINSDTRVQDRGTSNRGKENTMITITGEPKEIAALVVALQERRFEEEIRFYGKINGFLREGHTKPL